MNLTGRPSIIFVSDMLKIGWEILCEVAIILFLDTEREN